VTAKQPNRAGRPWQRKDGRWAARAYPPGQSKPKMVYGVTEDEVIARQAETESVTGPDACPDCGHDHETLECPDCPEGYCKPVRPPKPVRFTLDLDQDRHTFLKQFALECGPGVGGAQVMRALLDELREGANLPMRVRSRIQASKR
jgi:hypothetical protein